jgi:hypothetical protein
VTLSERPSDDRNAPLDNPRESASADTETIEMLEDGSLDPDEAPVGHDWADDGSDDEL